MKFSLKKQNERNHAILRQNKIWILLESFIFLGEYLKKFYRDHYDSSYSTKWSSLLLLPCLHVKNTHQEDFFFFIKKIYMIMIRKDYNFDKKKKLLFIWWEIVNLITSQNHKYTKSYLSIYQCKAQKYYIIILLCPNKHVGLNFAFTI